jgi:hypothetical protein
MIYLLSSLQEEETPQDSFFNGSDEKKSLQVIIDQYYSAHPSIIDKVFTGKTTFLLTK